MNKSQTATGTVVSIWRYPVKSMLGEELNASYVTERGICINDSAVGCKVKRYDTVDQTFKSLVIWVFCCYSL